MATSTPTGSTKRSSRQAGQAGSWIPEPYRDLAAVGFILLTVIIFFADALFGGKNFLAEGDNVAFYSFIPYLDAAKQAGEFPLWVPYIFSGMPSLASFLAAGDRSWDVLSAAVFAIPKFMGQATGNDTTRLALWYAIYGFGVYTLMRVKKHERLVATFSAVAAIFSTFVIVWIMIGHSTKPVSLATLPWILMALERNREKFSLLNVFLLTLAMITLVSATHPQMMFYLGCAAGLYLITELIIRLIQKNGAVDVLKSAGALVLATGIALGTHADMFMATQHYTPSSTRGSAPLVQGTDATVDQSGGNDYEYATNWSFSPEEMTTFLIPNYFGFGNLSIQQPGMAEAQRENLYWGQMPFTDAANYMGIGVLLLAILGAWYQRRDPFVIFLIVLSVFSLFLSFGKNLPILYDLFYHYAPAFNKFRAPSMALALLQFAAPVLAGYGISTIIGWAGNKEYARPAMIAGGLTAAFLVLGFIVPSTFEASYTSTVQSTLIEKYGQQIDPAVAGARATLTFEEMKSDWVATGFLALLFGATILALSRGSLKPGVAVAIFIALTLIDQWRVDKRPYYPEEGQPQETVFAQHADLVQWLRQDTQPYRIADLTSNRVPANWWAYHFIESIQGYSSAKLRVYQDLLDVAGPGRGRDPQPGNSIIANPFLWNLLNVRYIVAAQPIYDGIEPDFRSQRGLLIYRNPMAFNRAWFVDAVTVESNPRAILEALRDGTFAADSVAYVEKPLASSVQAADSAASVEVAERGNQVLRLKTSNTASSFLVVSEVFYDEWQCYVDGAKTETYKTNFALRGVIVPAGSHTVEFRFESPSFEQGRTISMASNALALLIGLGGLFMWWRQRKAVQA